MTPLVNLPSKRLHTPALVLAGNGRGEWSRCGCARRVPWRSHPRPLLLPGVRFVLQRLFFLATAPTPPHGSSMTDFSAGPSSSRWWTRRGQRAPWTARMRAPSAWRPASASSSVTWPRASPAQPRAKKAAAAEATEARQLPSSPRALPKCVAVLLRAAACDSWSPTAAHSRGAMLQASARPARWQRGQPRRLQRVAGAACWCSTRRHGLRSAKAGRAKTAASGATRAREHVRPSGCGSSPVAPQ